MAGKRGRIPISITLPKECKEWLDKKVESRIYDTTSHGVELLILGEIKREELNKDGK